MQSKAATVAEYISELPEDRRRAIQAIRAVIRKNLDPDIEEGMHYGMIGYAIPHRVFPQGYHCDPSQPLCVGGLASQKNAMSMYAMTVYGDPAERAWFTQAWKDAGKKLDMGKSCIRFKTLDAVPLDVVAQLFKRINAKRFIAHYLASLEARGAGSSRPAAKHTKKSATKLAKKPAKTTAKKTAAKNPARKSAK